MTKNMTKLSEAALAAKRMRRKSMRVVAAPDDPIYSRGWQIGSAPVYRGSTTASQQENSGSQGDSSEGQEPKDSR